MDCFATLAMTKFLHFCSAICNDEVFLFLYCTLNNEAYLFYVIARPKAEAIYNVLFRIWCSQ